MLLIAILSVATNSNAQSFYDINTIQKIEIYFGANNWDYSLDTAKAGNDDYVFADSVFINGIRFDSVGVKYKGNSSYDATYSKNPLHIELDAFKEQAYQGFKDIKLSNGYGDPSVVREVLAYDILRNYTKAPLSNFAQVYINQKYYGVFSNSESINKPFCAKYFGSNNNTFIKCNPIINAGPSSKCNLKFINNDSTSYYNFYEMKSEGGWADLIKLCDTITNNSAALDKIVNVDRAIWMLVFNNTLVNLDSYSGAFAQNYYLYKDNLNRFNPILWDLNMSFGSFPFAGSPSNGTGSLNLSGMQQLSPTLHASHSDWPLITAILSNPIYKRKYIAHMRTLVNEMFTSNYYQTKVATYQSLLDSAVLLDSNSFYNYSDFLGVLTTNKANGSFTIPGISNLMSARAAYLVSTTEFQQTPPNISIVTASNNSPALYDTITITAKITNATSAALNYRSNEQALFTTINLYDDGAHGDGLANDSIYGNRIKVTSVQTQYYLYAENSNAGMFAPERAEHEFYTLNIPISTINKGEIIINEVLANNKKSDLDETGNYEDWIELYNTTDRDINLFGHYLSDDFNTPQQFTFPYGTVIKAHQYLMVWADEKRNTAKYLHANFKLATEGEQVVLTSAKGITIDSVIFAAQQEDVSWGRCPSTTGTFTFIDVPTFEDANIFCTVGLSDLSLNATYKIYPNPTRNYLSIFTSNRQVTWVSIYNLIGEKIIDQPLNQNITILDVSALTPGLYVLSMKDNNLNLLKTIKLIIHN